MLLFIFMLMCSLLAQFDIGGKSSMYDIGVVKSSAAAAAAAATAVATDTDTTTAFPIAAKDSVYDTFNSEQMIRENVAEISTTHDKNQAASSTPTVKEITALTAGNKGQCCNHVAAAIYGHFNENDNNSHKLPQNVAKGGHQQPKMINMNTIRPAASAQLTSSSITEMSAGATETAARPPAETTLMPTDQLHEKVCSKNSNNIKYEIRNTKDTKILAKDSQAQKTRHNNTSNKNNSSNTLDSNLRTIFVRETKENQKEEHKIIKENKLKTFDSLPHARQQLILQFALKFKQIPRVTYFTCKEHQTRAKRAGDKLNPESMQTNTGTVELVRRLYKATVPSIMLKVVSIDHLANKNRENTASEKAHGRFAAAGDPAPKNVCTNSEWLEQILKPDTLRQIVVLDLNCGTSSHRLLEMASNKAFFNSMYHWLLLEDYDKYIFNRQTEIDDADDIENKMNSYSYNTQADKSFKEDIVNDSNIANLQVKKLSTYPTDVDGVFTSGSNPHDQITTKASNSSPSSAPSSLKMTAEKRRRQRWVDDKTSSATSFNASRAGITDEDATDAIEKFLEKLNININTELMLAKRRVVRSTAPPAISPTCCHLHSVGKRTQTEMPVPKLTPTNSRFMDSHDYNSLQKMDYYLLYDVWNAGLQYGGKLNITECGNFSRDGGLKLDKWFRTTSTTSRRLNMQLARIRCMVVITHKNRSDTLEQYLTTHYDTHLDSMNRFNFALLAHVRDLFNFSFILSQTSTWGYLKNGKFDGMIGALVRKQADVGGSPIFFRLERAKVIDYTTRTWVARPCFMFRHPRSSKQDRIVFLQPFSNEIWIFLFASGCLTIMLLWLLTSLEHKFNAKYGDTVNTTTTALPKVECNTKAGVFRRWFMMPAFSKSSHQGSRQRLFFDSLIFYIGAICQQGLSFSTFFFSGRCIVITSLLFAFAIYQFYSASIVGTLLMEKPKTIRTLRDLIHSSLEIGIEDIVYNRDYFLRTKDPDAQELYAKKVSSVPLTEVAGFADTTSNSQALHTPLTEMTDAQKAKAYRDILDSHKSGARAKTNEASKWYDPDYGVAKIKKGRFAFHVDVATAYKIIADTFTEKEICDLAEVQLFPPQKMVSIVQKGSPLRKAITYGLRRVTEVGLTDYQRKVWHSPKPRCIKQVHTDDLRVDMQTFTSALLVLIFGYAVSLLILSLEIVHFKLWQRYTTTLRI